MVKSNGKGVKLIGKVFKVIEVEGLLEMMKIPKHDRINFLKLNSRYGTLETAFT